MWLLKATDLVGNAQQFRVLPGSIKTIGRAAGADFIVEAPMVSRVHCRVTAQHDGLDVEDLDSTNGTFVNDQRITRSNLAPGDRLRVGGVELTIVKG